MFNSLIQEARILPGVWRRRVNYYWRFSEKQNLAFGAMLLLPLIGVGAIVYFAYTKPAPVNVVEVESALREAAFQRATDLRCLAENVYFEARGEPLKGQYAVAEVTLNRVRSRHFPKTVCEVVHEKRWDPSRRRFVAHFSWTELGPLSQPSGPAWDQAMSVAKAAYDATYSPVVPGALFYHATRIQPAWAKTQRVVTTIGRHIFYR
jgi:N-acetylmuramoyl-L-alanine amidase